MTDWTAAHEDIAVHAAAGYYYPGASRDDVLQEARIGVLKAITDWRPERGPFRPFAALCAVRQVVTGLKTAQRGKHRPLTEAVSLSMPVGFDDTAGELADFLPARHSDPLELLIEREEIAGIFRRFERLSDMERDAVLRVAVNGEPYEQVGQPKRVDNALQRGLRKLAA